MRLERAEVEQDVGHARGEDTSRGAAGEVAEERMSLGHAAAELVDQLAGGGPRRGELDTGLSHPSRDGEAAESASPVTPLALEPAGPALDDLADPVHGLDVVDQGRPAEEPDLGGKRGLLTRQPALPLEALEHRRLFAADVRPGTPAEVDRGKTSAGEP